MKGFGLVFWLCSAVIAAEAVRIVRCVCLCEALLGTWDSIQEGRKEHIEGIKEYTDF